MKPLSDDDPNDCSDYTIADLLTEMLESSDQLDGMLDKDSLQYKDEVVLRLIDTLEEYMSFSTMKDLFKLIVENT